MQNQTKYLHYRIQAKLTLLLNFLLIVQLLYPLEEFILRCTPHLLNRTDQSARERGQLNDIRLADLFSHSFGNIILFLHQQLSRPVFIDQPSNLMYVASLILLVLLQIKVIGLYIHTCNPTFTVLYENSKHHSFPKFFRLHSEVYAGRDYLSYLPFEDTVCFFVLVIFDLVQHQDWYPSFEQLCLGKLYLL